MYKSIDEYRKNHDLLIAIDSDGCVFNNMTIKHQKAFFPCLLEVMDLQDPEGFYARKWDEINLDYPLRGINRFLGLGKLLDEWQIPYETETYKRWLRESVNLSNDALTEWIDLTDDEFLRMVYRWSIRVNEVVEEMSLSFLPFPSAISFIEKAYHYGDIVVMSSANQDAIVREWSQSGILKYVSFIVSQDFGTKSFGICSLIEKGYRQENTLMIGDAVSDERAARENGVRFHQIAYKKEEKCWQLLLNEITGV